MISFALGLAACAGNLATPPSREAELPSAIPAVADITPTRTPPTTTSIGGARPEVLALVRADLAARLGVSDAQIRLEAIEAVEWPDSGLGCPLPGAPYAQVLTPGFRIVLVAGTAAYEFHTDQTEAVVLCQDGQPVMPEFPVIPGEIDDGEPWMPVN